MSRGHGDLNPLLLNSFWKSASGFGFVSDLTRRRFVLQPTRRVPRRFADVPLDRMQPVAAVRDMRHSEVLACRDRFSTRFGIKAPSGIWNGNELTSM